MSESFEQYKLKNLYNNFFKLKWRYRSIMKDFNSKNDVEGNNNKVKEVSENKKMTLSDCFDLFEEISKSQKNETKFSVRGLGKYLIAAGYSNLIFSANTWEMMDKKCQLIRINDIFKKRTKLKELFFSSINKKNNGHYHIQLVKSFI